MSVDFGLPPGLDPPVDEVTAPWWAATRERRLVIQHCRSCHAWQHYPRVLCTTCGALDPPFEGVSGRGVVDTFTEVHRAPDTGRRTPYLLARIRLDEGPCLLTNLVAAPARTDLIGCAVSLEWAPLADGRHLPCFRPH